MLNISLKHIEKLLDKKLKPLATKADLIKAVSGAQEELAKMVSNGFEQTDQKMEDLSKKIDVKIRVDVLERKMQRMESAL